MKKALKIFLKISEWLIFAVILIIFFIITSTILPTKKFFQTFIVTSGSMEPTVHTGSIAITRPAQNFQEKDIITFTSPSDPKQTVLHRIVSIDKDKIKTKGDANNGADIWTIPSSSVKGVFAFSIPFIGYPAAFLKTPKGFFILVIIPAILLIILQFKKIKEGINEEVIKRTEKAIKEKEKLIPIVILAVLISLAKSNYVQALFTSSVNVQGISISVASLTPTPSPTPAPSQTPTATTTPAPTPSPAPTSAPTSSPSPIITPSPSPASTPSNCNQFCQQKYTGLIGDCLKEDKCQDKNGSNEGYLLECTTPNEKICCCQ